MISLLRVAGLVALLLVALLAVAVLAQRRLLHFPSRYDLAAATGPARQAGLEPWLDRAYLRDVLQGPGLPPVDVLLLEYPGYGPREGSPSEESIVAATIDAIDLLGADLPVFLVGESLGSAAVALAAAERPKVAGLFLITPIPSVTALARALFQAYPGPKLLREVPSATHNTLPYRPGDPLWSEVTGFLLGYTPHR